MERRTLLGGLSAASFGVLLENAFLPDVSFATIAGWLSERHAFLPIPDGINHFTREEEMRHV